MIYKLLVLCKDEYLCEALVYQYSGAGDADSEVFLLWGGKAPTIIFL